MDYAGGEGNPSGIHKEGVAAKRKLDDARQKIARILECQARDAIFTSGGTESNNLAIFGVWKALRQTQGKSHVIIGENEHPSIVEPAREIERQGGELTVTNDPLKHIKENTVLVSIAYANNVTGAINNVPKIARLIRELRQKNGSKYPFIHTDASAAYEYLDIDINKVPADLITIEKVLVVRPNVTIRPLLLGGGQERGLRSGTENVSAIAAFAEDLERIVNDRASESQRLQELKEIFIAGVKEALPEAVINTPPVSLPNIVNLSFPGKLHEFLAIKLDEMGIAVSTGSSCDSSKSEKDKEALRFSFSKKTSETDVKAAIRGLRSAVL